MRSPEDAVTAQLTAQLASRVDTFEGIPHLSGTMVDVTLTSGSTVKVVHGLGRKWVGYLVCAQFNDGGADGRFWATPTALDHKHIALAADGYTSNPELRLWIF
jgi:hypothetical protein